MPPPQPEDTADAWLALLDHFERLWRSILKHQLHPTLKMD